MQGPPPCQSGAHYHSVCVSYMHILWNKEVPSVTFFHSNLVIGSGFPRLHIQRGMKKPQIHRKQLIFFCGKRKQCLLPSLHFLFWLSIHVFIHPSPLPTLSFFSSLSPPFLPGSWATSSPGSSLSNFFSAKGTISVNSSQSSGTREGWVTRHKALLVTAPAAALEATLTHFQSSAILI